MTTQTTPKSILPRTAIAIIIAIITLSITALAIGTTNAKAGGKRHFGFHGKHYKNPYLLKHEYVCEPRYITTWVYSKRHGKKIRRTIRIEDRCNMHYK
jgi:hypothetical protein